VVKHFENGDIAQCAKIMQAVYNNEMWQCYWDDDTAGAYLRDIVEHKKFVGFVLCENNEVIGAILCREKVWWNNSELYIEELFVLPRFQRRGYGQQLLRAAEEYVQKKQLAGITLSTNRYTFAPTFYRKNGFVDGEHVLFMYQVKTAAG
jgi:aminoglycoside 6'-N-acetyltransferase I